MADEWKFKEVLTGERLMRMGPYYQDISQFVCRVESKLGVKVPYDVVKIPDRDAIELRHRSTPLHVILESGWENNI